MVRRYSQASTFDDAAERYKPIVTESEITLGSISQQD